MQGSTPLFINLLASKKKCKAIYQTGKKLLKKLPTQVMVFTDTQKPL